MKKINLICIRHGESEANLDNSIYYKKPDHAIILTFKGKEQARELYKELLVQYPFPVSNHILYSPWTRVKQTVAEIKDLTYREPIVDPLIHEMLVMNSFAEMKTDKDFKSDDRLSFSPYWYKTGSSESYLDAYKRARIFLQDLKLNKYNFNDEDNVFIVSHGIFLSMLEVAIDNNPIEKERHLNNCGYFTRTIRVLDV